MPILAKQRHELQSLNLYSLSCWNVSFSFCMMQSFNFPFHCSGSDQNKCNSNFTFLWAWALWVWGGNLLFLPYCRNRNVACVDGLYHLSFCLQEEPFSFKSPTKGKVFEALNKGNQQEMRLGLTCFCFPASSKQCNYCHSQASELQY